MEQTRKTDKLANELSVLATEVEEALKKYAIVSHPQYGKVYALEVNGFGSYNLMDDANVPSLISMPYLDSVKNTDPVYIATRKMLLSSENPFFYKGKVAEGVGGPHVGKDMIWPLGNMRIKDLCTSLFIRMMLKNLPVHGLPGLIRCLENFYGKYTMKNQDF